MKSEVFLLWHLLYVSLCARSVSHVVGAPEEEDKEPEGSKMSFAFSSHRMDQACLQRISTHNQRKSLPWGHAIFVPNMQRNWSLDTERKKREIKISVPFQCQEVHKGEVPLATALLTDCKTCHDFLPCILSDGFSPKVWSRGHGKSSQNLTTVLHKTFLSPLSHNSANKQTLLLIVLLLPAAAAARQQGYCYNKMDSRVKDFQTGTEEHTRNPNVLASSAYSTGHRRSSLNACKGTSIPATTLSAANTTSAASPSCSWFGCSTSISISSPSSRSQVRSIQRHREPDTHRRESFTSLKQKPSIKAAEDVP